jgi:hypothetical protein
MSVCLSIYLPTYLCTHKHAYHPQGPTVVGTESGTPEVPELPSAIFNKDCILLTDVS